LTERGLPRRVSGKLLAVTQRRLLHQCKIRPGTRCPVAGAVVGVVGWSRA
jgi:hypothetical protein